MASRRSYLAPWAAPWNLFGHAPVRHLRGTRHAANIPLPRPRPAEAPKSAPEKSASEKSAPEQPASASPPPPETAKPAENKPTENKPAENKPAEPAAPQPSACRQALTAEIAIAPSIPDIHGPGGCGGEDLVRLEAIVLGDHKRVRLDPPATLRCTMAAAIADWVRTDIVPLAASLGSEPAELDNLDSYECRSFNGIAGAHLSEHGRANALDVRGFKLADGRPVVLTDRSEPREWRERVLHSACARFTTVLGPGSDWYHEEHIHLDLMQRHNDYRICQWNVWDPLPAVAPLLPVPRPDTAPPREVARDDTTKSDATKPGTGKAGPPAANPATIRPPTKKRR